MTLPDPADIHQVFTHGGARSNAGRKASGRPVMKARTLRFTPDALKRLERLKKALGLSWPKLIERLVEGFDLIPAASPVAHSPGCVCGGCMKVWREGRQAMSGCQDEDDCATPMWCRGKSVCPRRAVAEEPLRPLFIPLKAEFFEAFENGTKDTEYRKRGPRWNAETCKVGRKVVLSYGYGKARRLSGIIMGFCYDTAPAKLPGWVACYGEGAGDAACIRIKLDRPGLGA